ncbi:MAG: DEAD/DEAH box helicase, partial [Propionibacteriaceae bacterium]|nr:DEAD/DEAH box helicase [Propionibacteriaceae bacterium]
MTEPSCSSEILRTAIESIGGEQRAGQQQMANAVFDTFTGHGQLLVQAGTGTGKSLGYLAPALAYLSESSKSRVVIATATLALQGQLANKDIPSAVAACARVTGKTIASAVLKGRSNYACLQRVREAGSDQASLFGAEDLAVDSSSELGAAVVGLREWAEEQLLEKGLADRDDAPSHVGAAWAQVSMSA